VDFDFFGILLVNEIKLDYIILDICMLNFKFQFKTNRVLGDPISIILLL